MSDAPLGMQVFTTAGDVTAALSMISWQEMKEHRCLNQQKTETGSVLVGLCL